MPGAAITKDFVARACKSRLQHRDLSDPVELRDRLPALDIVELATMRLII